MSKQLDYYYRHRETINANRRKSKTGKAKAVKQPTTTGKTNIGKTDSDVKSLGKSQPTVRLHALALSRRYDKPLSIYELESKLKEYGIPYIKKGLGFCFSVLHGFNARFTTRTMTLWALQKEAPRSSKNVNMLNSQAFKELEAIFEQYAEAMNLDMVAEPEILERHIAFTQDEYASNVEEGVKIRILDKNDNLLRFLIDFSDGIPEAEFVHAKYSQEDAEKYAEFVEKETITGWSIKIEKNMIEMSEAMKVLANENVNTAKLIRSLLEKREL